VPSVRVVDDRHQSPAADAPEPVEPVEPAPVAKRGPGRPRKPASATVRLPQTVIDALQEYACRAGIDLGDAAAAAVAALPPVEPDEPVEPAEYDEVPAGFDLPAWRIVSLLEAGDVAQAWREKNALPSAEHLRLTPEQRKALADFESFANDTESHSRYNPRKRASYHNARPNGAPCTIVEVLDHPDGPFLRSLKWDDALDADYPGQWRCTIWDSRTMHVLPGSVANTDDDAAKLRAMGIKVGVLGG